MSHGEVRRRVWFYQGKCRETWGFTIVINGKRVRRQGYGSRAEAQDGLDGLKHPQPERAPAPVATITFGDAFERYFLMKARKRSLEGDRRYADHLKIEFGGQTPIREITASR